MWPYSFVTRAEFEKRKDFVDRTLRHLGCEVLPASPQRMTMYGKGFQETWISERPLYQFHSVYIHIGEVLHEKPFLVLELTDTLEEAKSNEMEDADPFPYDLSDDEIVLEVKRSLGLEECPNQNVP